MMNFMRINDMMIGPIGLLMVVIAGTLFIGAIIAVIVLIMKR